MSRQRELSLLGYSGLIPFFVGALMTFVDKGPNAFLGASIVIAYGTVIVSYMAGMGAGALIVKDKPAGRPLLPGMICTLIVWIATLGFLLNGKMIVGATAMLAMIATFAYLLFIDLIAVEKGGLPDWYGPLRIRLTIGACSALALASFRSLTL
ncbi:MAG: DUF3429 domain-containing protein [Pseudomonadota bacterium]